jgi:hypothetical protein
MITSTEIPKRESEIIEKLINTLKTNPKMQGHICINNSEIFELSLFNQVYGFPSNDNVMNLSAWRANSSLYNIGGDDLIFFYRTRSESGAPGSQEFHGIFKMTIGKLSNLSIPLRFFHPNDSSYAPTFMGKKGRKYCQCRMVLEPILKVPISIKNDINTSSGTSLNNNTEIIKAFMTSKLWGFRHPTVMNIGAARKKSIVAISNQQTRFLLEMMLKYGHPRPLIDLIQIPILNKYDIKNLPTNAILLDDNFLKNSITYKLEVELYAFLINAFKNQSTYSNETLSMFDKINRSIFQIPFNQVCQNVILECLITPHIQEELDILLCDQSEKLFIIIEVKKGVISQIDIAQANKYIELLRIIFPNANTIGVNLIGTDKEANVHNENKFIKLIKFEREPINLISFIEIP